MTSNKKNRSYREDVTARALQFLRVVGTGSVIRAELSKAGYTNEDHMEGFNLLCAITEFPKSDSEASDENPVAEAIASIEAWSDVLRRGKNVLGRLYPKQEEKIFGGVEISKGMEGVVTTKVILDRLDAIEGDKGSAEAFEALAKRGVTKAERKRVRALVELAHSTPKVFVPSDDRAEEVEKLRAWLADWSDTARTVIHRRDFLIRLGVSRRKAGNTPPPPAVGPVATPIEIAHAAE